MWTNDNRARYDRSKLRYPSDLTEEEWAVIGPMIPPAKRGGNKRTVSEREVVNGLMYILSTGCQWAALPKDLPPRSTVNDYFRLWDYDGTLDRIHHALYVKCRELAGREASPTAAIIDSQSVKSAEKGALHRSAGLRRRQKDQGKEAPHPCRYARLAVVRHRSCRRYPRSRRWGLADERPVRTVSVSAQTLRGQRLPRRKVSKGTETGLRPDQRRNRQALGRGQVRCPPETLDCRKNNLVAQPLPAPGQRL